ncbi:MAG: hypothetical protein GXO54_03070, partial [Chloroflexi bacterium]|nr:hypothetical protein [Chloroflexota bacterium]
MAGRLTNPRFWARVRLALVVISVVLLVYGVLAGLQRLGWAIGGTAGRLAVHHGSVMVVMFFGALIALERAAALQKPWTYIPPILLALAGLLALVDAPMPLIKG